jgi:hypothetical protein
LPAANTGRRVGRQRRAVIEGIPRATLQGPEILDACSAANLGPVDGRQAANVGPVHGSDAG